TPSGGRWRSYAAGGAGVRVGSFSPARRSGDVITREERPPLAARPSLDVRLTLTREQPDGWEGYAGRIDRAMLDDVAWPADERPRVYVCGPTGFVEATAEILVALGHDPRMIRTERFGASGP